MSWSTFTNASEEQEYNKNSTNALNGKKVNEGCPLENSLDKIHEERRDILPIPKQQKSTLDTKCNLPKRTKNESQQEQQQTTSAPWKTLNQNDKKTMNNYFDSKSSSECMNELENNVPASS